jgi:5'(3')-deoxyribonucleotidase
MWNPRRIGIDLDGVLIDHREHKLKLAAEYGIALEGWQANANVIKLHVPLEHLRTLHSDLYGPMTLEAKPVVDALKRLAELKAEVYIVSARRAENIRFAQDWLVRHRVYDVVPAERIVFCATDEEKKGYCERLNIDLFLDDKVSVLDSLGARTKRVLFDEDGVARRINAEDRYPVVKGWEQFVDMANGAPIVPMPLPLKLSPRQ